MAFHVPAVHALRGLIPMVRLHGCFARRGWAEEPRLERPSDHTLNDIGLRRDDVRRDFGRHALRHHLGI